MWAVLFFAAFAAESLLLIVLWHGGAIDGPKASAAVETSMAKLASLFKRK